MLNYYYYHNNEGSKFVWNSLLINDVGFRTYPVVVEVFGSFYFAVEIG